MNLPPRWCDWGSPNPAYINVIYSLVGIDRIVMSGQDATVDDVNIIFQQLGSAYRVVHGEPMDPSLDKLEGMLKEKYDST